MKKRIWYWILEPRLLPFLSKSSSSFTELAHEDSRQHQESYMYMDLLKYTTRFSDNIRQTSPKTRNKHHTPSHPRHQQIANLLGRPAVNCISSICFTDQCHMQGEWKQFPELILSFTFSGFKEPSGRNTKSHWRMDCDHMHFSPPEMSLYPFD